MKKIFFISLVIFFYFNKSVAIEIYCNFEEVYKDGQVQKGFFLIKDDSLRYEYTNQNLFIIFKEKENFYAVKKKI